MRKLLFYLFLVLSSCAGNKTTDKETFSGVVVRIADGDTFTLLTDEKEQIKIRLHGIDCPEKSQDFGQVSRQKLADLIFNKKVTAKKIDVDRYKRIIALVYDEESRCVNEEMLKAGLAWHYTRYDSNEEWSSLETSAKEQKIGIWSQPNPTPPWEWRKK